MTQEEIQMDMFQEFEQMSQETPDQVTLAQVESLIKEYTQARNQYDEASKVKKEAEQLANDLENKVMSMLERIGRKSFDVEGVGKVTKCMKLSFKTPKTVADKLALFDYIKNAHGDDVYNAMISINSQTLNSWANKEIETGEVNTIPGLEAPQSQEYLQLRRV